MENEITDKGDFDSWQHLVSARCRNGERHFRSCTVLQFVFLPSFAADYADRRSVQFGCPFCDAAPRVRKTHTGINLQPPVGKRIRRLVENRQEIGYHGENQTEQRG